MRFRDQASGALVLHQNAPKREDARILLKLQTGEVCVRNFQAHATRRAVAMHSRQIEAGASTGCLLQLLQLERDRPVRHGRRESRFRFPIRRLGRPGGLSGRRSHVHSPRRTHGEVHRRGQRTLDAHARGGTLHEGARGRESPAQTDQNKP